MAMKKRIPGYASNKYKQGPNKLRRATLGDDFIIQKISDGRFSTLEDWKKAYFNEVVPVPKMEFRLLTVDGKTYNSYEGLKRAFAEAVDKDKATLSNGSVKFDNTCALERKKSLRNLLQQTDSFKTSIFK